MIITDTSFYNLIRETLHGINLALRSLNIQNNY
jgi:hypothetical protein